MFCSIENRFEIPLMTTRTDRWLGRSAKALMTTVWLSAAFFALYILAFYIGTWATGGDLARWDQYLHDLYEPSKPESSAFIGLHFAFGAIILLLGFIQFMPGIRACWPRIHRVTGRIYVFSCLATSVGGLGFIVTKGTTGGVMMDIGFALNGLLFFTAGVMTIREAMKRRLTQHRAWAYRLFALAISSWLYRMYYGLWFALFGPLGHKHDFTGWFDQVMNFWFYLPSLLVAEIFIARHSFFLQPAVAVIGTLLMSIASVAVVVATWRFAERIWMLHILDFLGIPVTYPPPL